MPQNINPTLFSFTIDPCQAERPKNKTMPNWLKLSSSAADCNSRQGSLPITSGYLLQADSDQDNKTSKHRALIGYCSGICISQEDSFRHFVKRPRSFRRN